MEVTETIVAYFQSIFSSSSPAQSSIDLVSNLVLSKPSPHESSALETPFTAVELKTAVFDTGATKSPGPDGIHGILYQKYWHIVGADVTKVCLDILNNRSPIASLISIHLVLIPKVKFSCHLD